MKKIENLSKEEKLNLVDTEEGTALAVDDFSQALVLAKKYDLDIVQLQRKFGENFWTLQGTVSKPFDNMVKDGFEDGDLYLTADDAENYYDNFIKCLFEEDQYKEPMSYPGVKDSVIEDTNRIVYELKKLPEGKILVAEIHDLWYRFVEIIDRYTTYCQDDNREYQIALMN